MKNGYKAMRFGIAGALMLAVVSWPPSRLGAADPVRARVELERVERLVKVGALPRRALHQARDELERALHEQTLRQTHGANLSEAGIPELLRAVAKLRELARDNLNRTRVLVEAGAMPADRLKPAVEAAEAAERQYEMTYERVKLVRELASMVRAEQRLKELQEAELAFYSEGETAFWDQDLLTVLAAFHEEFGKDFPISADGDTEVHRSMGFDHSGRIDVALHPEDLEGLFLIDLLETWGLPYIAFHTGVPGQATGAHIHIGPPSEPIEVEEP